jgi:hypothetical protein
MPFIKEDDDRDKSMTEDYEQTSHQCFEIMQLNQ